MKKNSRRASKTYKEANKSGALAFQKQIDARHIEHDSIMLDDGEAVSKIGAVADATADSILENFLPYLGWTWSCNCNSTTGNCTCTITNTGGGSGGGGDTVTDVQTSLTGTTLTTAVITDLGTHSDDVDLSSLSGGGVGGEPLYTADKPGIALNSTEDVTGAIINLNNGDGSTKQVYATSAIDDMFDEKLDVVTFESSQAIQDARITNAENDLTDLQLMLESVILEEETLGPVVLSPTPVSILTFPTVVTAGKYNGAMRATWSGSGLRSVTLTIYINGVATSRTTTESYTDNQTASLFTSLPLDLVEGDVVEVYASSATGSVSAIAGALQLVLSNGTIDLTAYETVADHTADMATVNDRIDSAQLHKITLDDGDPLLRMSKDGEVFAFRQLVSARGVSPDSADGFTDDMVGIAMGDMSKGISAQLGVNTNTGKTYAVYAVENPLDAGTQLAKYRPLAHEDELDKIVFEGVLLERTKSDTGFIYFDALDILKQDDTVVVNGSVLNFEEAGIYKISVSGDLSPGAEMTGDAIISVEHMSKQTMLLMNNIDPAIGNYGTNFTLDFNFEITQSETETGLTDVIIRATQNENLFSFYFKNTHVKVIKIK